MAGYKNVYVLNLCIISLFIATVFVSPTEIKTVKSQMKLTGKITVTGEGISLGEKSFLIVKLEDISRLDTSAVLLGEQQQLLPAGTKLGNGSDRLNYTIVCEKPEILGPMYSVSAVLNVGWKASGDEWIRKGDYFTDTAHDVDLNQSEPIVVDIVMVHYS